MTDSPQSPPNTDEAMQGLVEAGSQAVNFFKQGIDSWAPLLAPLAAAGEYRLPSVRVISTEPIAPPAEIIR